MDRHQIRDYLLAKPETIEDFPFGIEVAVFKVKHKMFATLSAQDGIANMNLKCDPAEALALRDIFASVKPGYHMNKKHWNTIILDGGVPDNEIKRMIDNSFLLVVQGMPKKDRTSIEIQL
ncbi:MmcQ/YjbR family DNA-binding protein [Catenovulum sp. 2E275]|uniref:MmcQ/YjbR family DNA-binding protein n=1 Tax=Catenovulum sp. 2E275 TaxID=2980497 RepID=UPI0021CED8E6|nr:MmcQ/YjbR family DNA-binding protein [Catenovulum sp. 2E275]MCU4674864.1 MmcQ/YjbR family DNA-binding protein [Catenovulum sp. 2E275]